MKENENKNKIYLNKSKLTKLIKKKNNDVI